MTRRKTVVVEAPPEEKAGEYAYCECEGHEAEDFAYCEGCNGEECADCTEGDCFDAGGGDDDEETPDGENG